MNCHFPLLHTLLISCTGSARRLEVYPLVGAGSDRQFLLTVSSIPGYPWVVRTALGRDGCAIDRDQEVLVVDKRLVDINDLLHTELDGHIP